MPPQSQTPRWLVTLPDGREFEVESPTQPTEAQVLAELKQNPSLGEMPKEPAAPYQRRTKGTSTDTLGTLYRTGAEKLAQWIGNNPTEAAATAGAVAAVPLTGGASLLPSMAAAGLGGAGGAGIGTMIDAIMGGPDAPQTSGDVLRTMATQGALNAVGEGAGNLVVKGIRRAVPVILKKTLNPGKLLDEFPNVIETARQERLPIGQSQKARGRMKGATNEVDRILAARDAATRERFRTVPALPPAREPVPLGGPPDAGAMPGALVDPATTVVPRDVPPGAMPDRSGLDALVDTRQHLGGAAPALPVQRLGFGGDDIRLAESIGPQSRVAPTSALKGEGTPGGTRWDTIHMGDPAPGTPPLPDAPGLSGPGVVMRPANAPPGVGAYPGQVSPHEVVRRGLGTALAETGDRALSSEARGQLMDLIRKYLANHPVAETLTASNATKKSSQRLGNAAMRAADQNNTATEIGGIFHKGIAAGNQQLLEREAPEIVPLNEYARDMLGLSRVMRNAERVPEASAFSLNPMNWQSVRGRLPFVLDDLAKPLAGRTGQEGEKGLLEGRIAQAIRQGLFSGAGGLLDRALDRDQEIDPELLQILMEDAQRR